MPPRKFNAEADQVVIRRDNVLLPLSIVISGLVIAATGGWWCNAILTGINARFDRLEERQSQSWSVNQMRQWGYDASANTGWKSPDVDAIVARIK